MTHAQTIQRRINIRISKRAYNALSKRAKKEGRTILSTIDALLSI